MASTILHLEDNLALRALVQLEFQRFGFRGQFMAARTVAAAKKILDEAERAGTPIDLIISDMHVHDGTGLELVTYVRSRPAWHDTPIVMLSSDLDPAKVGLAYTLGANAYVDKAPHGWPLGDIVTMLYGHWLGSVGSSAGSGQDRLQKYLARASDHRARHARLYQRVALMFAGSPAESQFWLGQALRELNATNVLAFLMRKLSERDLPGAVIDQMATSAERVERALTAAETALDDGSLTRDNAYSHLLDLVSAMGLEVLSGALERLVRNMPVAIGAARDFLLGVIHDVVAFIDTHSDDAALRERAARLRTRTASAFARAPLSTSTGRAARRRSPA